MKRFLTIFFVFLLFISPFFQEKIPVFAITSPNTAIISTNNYETNTLTKLWIWLKGKFKKTDYKIGQERQKNDLTEYKDNKNKQAFAGSRITDMNTQNCLKGNIIKKVILKKTGYNDSNLAKICLDSSNKCVVKAIENSTNENNCQVVTIKDLAHYFVQLNQKFYCTTENKLIDIEQDVKNAVKTNPGLTIPIIDSNLGCYSQIYDQFYLTPKEETNPEEENIKTMIQIPIPQKYQDSSKSTNELKNQLDANFSPERQKNKIYNLRPENEK